MQVPTDSTLTRRLGSDSPSHHQILSNKTSNISLHNHGTLLCLWLALLCLLTAGQGQSRNYGIDDFLAPLKGLQSPNCCTIARGVLLLPHTWAIIASNHCADNIFPTALTLEQWQPKWNTSCWPACEEPSGLDSDGREKFANGDNPLGAHHWHFLRLQRRSLFSYTL